ncbi:DUF1864 family protein [Arenicella sp. 4NH20-0111]|uniref:PrnB family protein n=1 Tax=Arenicella sp. 4NH20-0111 TaxID=3127648 RepID=UPI0031060C9C
MSTVKAENLDHWIRNGFRDLNTDLEALYNQQPNPNAVVGIGHELKRQLVRDGTKLVSDLLNEGNTDEGFDNGFNLLGNVGFFMAACRRHEVSELNLPDIDAALKKAAALSLQLGASLGVVPRFASAHLETHNQAINGISKSFTHLADESLFIEYNTRGVLAFIRASEALLNILPLGVSHPITHDLLVVAKRALDDVVKNNQALFDQLDTDRFFFNIRPYYKPHYVGLREYRGANAGDFSGINVIDLLLGLCRADDAYYSQLLVDKFLFMRPEDQLVLRDCMRRTSLLDEFLVSLNEGKSDTDWYQRNLSEFLKVCKAHGDTAIQHHTMLIEKFIEKPAEKASLTDQQDLTASGPPLPIMLKGLKKLCDLRSAANVDGLNTRHDDLMTLQRSIEERNYAR